MTDLKDFRTGFKQSQTRHILEPLASLFQAASVLPSPFTKSLEGKDYFASPDCERTSGKNFLSNIRTWILRPQPGCFIYKNYQQLSLSSVCWSHFQTHAVSQGRHGWEADPAEGRDRDCTIAQLLGISTTVHQDALPRAHTAPKRSMAQYVYWPTGPNWAAQMQRPPSGADIPTLTPKKAPKNPTKQHIINPSDFPLLRGKRIQSHYPAVPQYD